MADLRKQFAASFFHLDHKYKVSWECAELLIELGGGPPASPSQPNSSTLPSAQLMHPGDSINSRKSRERAITLAGDESAPPLSMSIAGPSTTSPPGEWRGSAGRNDLSQRQLWLLRDMLNRSDSSPTMLANLQTLEEIPNRGWLWGEATSSTITLPSEESGRNASPTTKKRRYSRLGMSGLRDMLRSLTRGHQPPPVPPLPFRPGSSASTSASSSYDDQSTHQQHRPAKSSTGPDSTPSVRTSSPFSTSPGLTLKSPRRPSIASIFRFAQKNKPSPPAAASSSREHSRTPHARHILHSYSSGSDLASRSGNGTADGDGDGDDEEDEDWDHIDAAEDLDTAVRVLGVPTTREMLNGAATVRGRRSKLQQRRPEIESEQHKQQKASPGTLASTSQSSISLWATDSPSTASRSQVSLAAAAAAATTSSPPTSTSSPQPHTPPLPLPLSQATSSSSYLRPTRLSNVEESAEAQLDGESSTTSATTRGIVNGRSKSPRRPTSTNTGSIRRGGTLTGSVRSAPPPTPSLMPPQEGIDKRGLALSLTPETIRPLLENARKVHVMCTECVGELRALLASRP